MADFIPFVQSLHMHRFVGGVQIFALCSAACFVDSPVLQTLIYVRAVAPTNAANSGDQQRAKKLRSWFIVAGVPLCAWMALSAVQALGQRWTLLEVGRSRQLSWNQRWKPHQVEALQAASPFAVGAESNAILKDSRESDLALLVQFLRSQKPARVFAGFLEHRWYQWINSVLQESGFDMVGPLYHTMAITGQFMSRHFDFQSERAYTTFNVRCVENLPK